MEITAALVAEHGLTEDEFERIKVTLGREPNYVELGIYSVMWSEHCSYKSSRKYLGGFPTEGPQVIEGPGENAGVVDIGDNLACIFKMESHNHPSYIEPFQGAATGVGGIMRDVFTMGARPVASLNSLRFGSMEHKKTPYLLEGVVAGIAGYGNCMGVPTVGGEVYFHESYDGNCLVNAMTAGIVKQDKIFRSAASGVGNPLIYVGSATGRDGIHGAVMASDVFGDGGEERRPTVQVGDPFTEKLLLEACLEAFKGSHIVGIQDMGAAGLTSSSVEMAGKGGLGIEIDALKVPRREDGMTPYEVFLSESQERMLMVAEEGSEEAVMEIFHKWDLEAVVIGRVIDENVLRITSGDKLEGEMPISSLTDDAPVYDRPVKRPKDQSELNTLDLNSLPLPTDYNDALLRIVASENISSRAWIYRQYDHMVRTDTIVAPGSDAAVVRVKENNKAIALTTDCNSRYCYLDPYTGAKIAVAEAARNLIASGAKPLALTDCLNFGSPERPEVMWQFKEACRGITDACLAFDVPVVSGNVSFYNETSGRPIYPTPTIGMVGLIDDLSLVCTSSFVDEGDIIVLLGETLNELGGSEYLKVIHALDKGLPPKMDLEVEKKVQQACLKGIRTGIIKSAHDLSEGGLAIALFESCLLPGSERGASVDLSGSDLRPDALLFGESQSRFIVTLSAGDLDAFISEVESTGVRAEAIGAVGGENLVIEGFIDMPVNKIRERWEATIIDYVR